MHMGVSGKGGAGEPNPPSSQPTKVDTTASSATEASSSTGPMQRQQQSCPQQRGGGMRQGEGETEFR